MVFRTGRRNQVLRDARRQESQLLPLGDPAEGERPWQRRFQDREDLYERPYPEEHLLYLFELALCRFLIDPDRAREREDHGLRLHGGEQIAGVVIPRSSIAHRGCAVATK